MKASFLYSVIAFIAGCVGTSVAGVPESGAIIIGILAAIIVFLVALPNKKTPPRTQRGGRHGLEPAILEPVQLSPSPTMIGWPGKGLDRSGFASNQVELGQRGELLLAKALTYTGIIKSIATLWSLTSPDKHGRPNQYGTDIDCVIVTGTTIYLVDAKYYAAGNVTYRSRGDYLYCTDNVSGMLIGQPRKMGKNMAWTRATLSTMFPGIPIIALVCFIPTEKGEASLANVEWPGGVPAYTLSTFLTNLCTDVKHHPYTGRGKTATVVNQLRRFVN